MKQLLILLMLLCSTIAFAQDVIVKKDGSTILSKVLEVGQDEVKYKKYSNLDGPTYTISKSELKSINYQNGAKDTFSSSMRENNRFLPNNQNDGVQQYNDRALLQLDAVSYNSKRAKALKTTGWIGGCALMAAGVTFFIFYQTSYDSEKTHGYESEWALPASLACAGGAVAWTTTFLLMSNHEKKKAQLLQTSSLYQYNYSLPNGSSLSLGADLLHDNTLGQNTIGLGLRYNF